MQSTRHSLFGLTAKGHGQFLHMGPREKELTHYSCSKVNFGWLIFAKPFFRGSLISRFFLIVKTPKIKSRDTN